MPKFVNSYRLQNIIWNLMEDQDRRIFSSTKMAIYGCIRLI